MTTTVKVHVNGAYTRHVSIPAWGVSQDVGPNDEATFSHGSPAPVQVELGEEVSATKKVSEAKEATQGE